MVIVGSAAESDGSFTAGYCDTTVEGTGDCNTDDKGNIRWHGQRTWDKAFAACRQACLGCARCNVISVSLKWMACDWFHECDLSKLRSEVDGFRSVAVRGSGSSGGGDGSSGTDMASLHRLWSRLRAETTPPEPQECWAARCGALHHEHYHLFYRVAVSLSY